VSHKSALYGFTDYPIAELGDLPGKCAPVRAVRAISYDSDKYVVVEVQGKGIRVSIKRGYIYRKRQRYGGHKCFSHNELRALPDTCRGFGL
jgi:hypothetical protein